MVDLLWWLQQGVVLEWFGLVRQLIVIARTWGTLNSELLTRTSRSCWQLDFRKLNSCPHSLVPPLGKSWLGLHLKISKKFWENSTLSLIKNLRDEIWSTNFSSPVVTAFLCKLYCHFYDLITPWMTYPLQLCLVSYRHGFIFQFRVSASFGLQLVLPFEVSLYTSTYFTTPY